MKQPLRLLPVVLTLAFFVLPAGAYSQSAVSSVEYQSYLAHIAAAATSYFSFSTDGKRAISASSDQTVRIWDTRTGENVLTLPFDEQVWGVVFSPDGKRVITPADGQHS